MRRGGSIRGWSIEIGLACVAAVLGVLFLRGSAADGSPPRWLDVTVGIAACLALILFRRDHPVALTLVLIPAGIVFAMSMGATPVALFSAALHRRARVAVALTVLHALLVAGTYALALGLGDDYYEAVVFLVLMDVSLVAVAMLVRSQRRLMHSLAERAREAEEGQRMRVEQARLGERERLAREMHDVLAHRLSLLAVHAGALEVRRGAGPAERTAASVIRQGAHDAIEDLREVIGMLRDPAEDRPQPTLGDLPALVEQSRAAGASVTCDVTSPEDGVPVAMGRHAYRIVQEGLTNARKHAPGAAVRVLVHGDAGSGLVVEVGNRLAGGSVTGAGGGSIPGAGAGLAGLAERVSLAGGRLEHGPTPAGEFELRAWLPWPR